MLQPPPPEIDRERRERSRAEAAQRRRASPEQEPRRNPDTRAREPERPLTNADVQAMVRQIMSESRNYTNEDYGIERSHTPFTDDILEFQFPRRFNLPQMDKYNGRTDPGQHLMRYSWLMNAAAAPDAVKCKAFPIYLEDVALFWFTRLPPRLVSNYRELSERFMNQFRLHTQSLKVLLNYQELRRRQESL